MPTTTEQIPFATTTPPDPHRPRRRRLILVLVAFGIVSPVIAAFVGLRGHRDPGSGQPAIAASVPGARWPYDPQVTKAYRRYMQSEGVAARGAAFADCAMALNMLIVPRGRAPTRAVSEAELLFYLGGPDLMWDAANGTVSYVYLYDRFGKQDWAVYVTVTTSGGQRVVSQMGWNAANVNSHAAYRPYAANAPASSATKPD